MDKPENKYTEGTILYRLLDEDWSRKSILQVADELKSTEKSIRMSIYKIKRDTGYQVPYLHVPTTPNKYKQQGTFSPPPRKPKEFETPNKCDTCRNVDCRFLLARRAVCWTDCHGYIGG